MKMKTIFIFIFFSINCFAQFGPCDNCEAYKERTEPSIGFWYNPERSGVGLSIEIQNNRVFGVYNGFDSTGSPLWYTFKGNLVPSTKLGVMWELDSRLLKHVMVHVKIVSTNLPKLLMKVIKFILSLNKKILLVLK